MKTIVITGGLGFIGSHICVELIENSYNVIIIDNLENSSEDVYDSILNITKSDKKKCKLYICDLCDKNITFGLFNLICKSCKIHGIIHCAGKKSVGESIHKPLLYYNDNISMTLNVLQCIEKHNIPNFVFSSSATVYGTSNNNSILKEDSIVGCDITNPYGKTKYMQEEIIKDFSVNHKDKTFIILRYFNPVSAHKSGLIGENPNGKPNNLMPYILRVAANNNSIGWHDECYKLLTIFGNNYLTDDGTCKRDFIHVVDLANAHVSVFDFELKFSKHYWVFNVGTGNSKSVLEIVNAFKSCNNIDISYKFGDPREGDIANMMCNCERINSVVGWKSKYTLDDIVIDGWNYMKKYLKNDS